MRAEVERIKAYAREHVLPANRLDKLSQLKDPNMAIGLDPNTRIMFPFGYRVVYSLEEQPVQGICHHLSISVEEEVTPTPPHKVLPSEPAVNMILETFGINKPVEKCLFIWIEDIEDGGGGAINIIDKAEEEAHGAR